MVDSRTDIAILREVEIQKKEKKPTFAKMYTLYMNTAKTKQPNVHQKLREY